MLCLVTVELRDRPLSKSIGGILVFPSGASTILGVLEHPEETASADVGGLRPTSAHKTPKLWLESPSNLLLAGIL